MFPVPCSRSLQPIQGFNHYHNGSFKLPKLWASYEVEQKQDCFLAETSRSLFFILRILCTVLRKSTYANEARSHHDNTTTPNTTGAQDAQARREKEVTPGKWERDALEEEGQDKKQFTGHGCQRMKKVTETTKKQAQAL